jgi:DNA-binding response OmpR family regulator
MRRVLLVDDDLNIRKSLTLLLQASYEVSTAEDGAVALELMKEQRFDVVVLDLMMPVLNGTQVLEELRRRGSQVPIIVISAHQELDMDQEKYRQIGAFATLRKPFHIVELEKWLEKALNREVTGGPQGPGGSGNAPGRDSEQGDSAAGIPSSARL